MYAGNVMTHWKKGNCIKMCRHCENIVSHEPVDPEIVYYESVETKNWDYGSDYCVSVQIAKSEYSKNAWLCVTTTDYQTLDTSNVNFCPWCGRKL